MRSPPPPTVAVVDDDEAFRDSLVWLLRASGHTVDAYENGTTFLAGWHPERPGCLLLDIRMPDMTGLYLQDELIRRGYTAPVVFLTGHGDVPMAVNALQKGALHFLEKPCNDRDLLDVVTRALAEDRRARDSRGQRELHRARLARLTPRERAVLERVVAGKINKVTADELGVTVKTVEAHRAQLMKKLDVDSTAQLVRLWYDVGESPMAPDTPPGRS